MGGTVNKSVVYVCMRTQCICNAIPRLNCETICPIFVNQSTAVRTLCCVINADYISVNII